MNTAPQRPYRLEALDRYARLILGEYAEFITSINPLILNNQDGLSIHTQDDRSYWISPACELHPHSVSANPDLFEKALNTATSEIMGFYHGLLAKRNAHDAAITLDF